MQVMLYLNVLFHFICFAIYSVSAWLNTGFNEKCIELEWEDQATVAIWSVDQRWLLQNCYDTRYISMVTVKAPTVPL